MSENKNFYVISFSVAKDSGLALVVAENERSAIEHLRHSGKYNGCSAYSIINTRCLGSYCGCEYGLIYESFSNALVAFQAIESVLLKIKGEKGDKGDKGNPGPVGPQGGVVWPEMYVDDDLWLHILEPESQLSDRLYFEDGWLKIIQ